MPGIDKPTGRVVAVIVLLVFVAASLRGYLPANVRVPHEDHRAALVFVVALLGVSLGLVAVSIVARLRDPHAVAHSPGGLPARPGGRGERPSWRVVLIGLGVIVVWLLVVSLLIRLFGHHGIVQSVPGPESPTPSSTNNTTAPSPPQPGPHNGGGDVFHYLLASTATLLLLLVASAVVASRRRPRTAKPAAADDQPERFTPTAGAETLARAAELGLVEIGNLSREPREAIIACYAVMEHELANVPGAVPQDFDTPTEVLARAVEHHALQADNAVRLVNLFTEARFSPHVMTEGHREDAVRVLRLVLAELRLPAGGAHRSGA